MNTLDIILLVCLALAAVSGWHKGIIVQALRHRRPAAGHPVRPCVSAAAWAPGST